MGKGEDIFYKQIFDRLKQSVNLIEMFDYIPDEIKNVKLEDIKEHSEYILKVLKDIVVYADEKKKIKEDIKKNDILIKKKKKIKAKYSQEEILGLIKDFLPKNKKE